MVKMEEEIKSLQKHMAGLVRTILDLKSKVESLEERVEGNKTDDLEELIQKQKRVDEAIGANSAAIMKIDEEIKVLSTSTKQPASEANNNEYKERRGRKCRYYNRGHCKQKSFCEFTHPRDICQSYLEGKKCEMKQCKNRHPKVCKYWSKSKAGCRREGFCDFLH